jgi:hypothetical protein
MHLVVVLDPYKVALGGRLASLGKTLSEPRHRIGRHSLVPQALRANELRRRERNGISSHLGRRHSGSATRVAP